MKEVIKAILLGALVGGLFVVFCIAIREESKSSNLQGKKTRLEIEKLKYELSIYKENEESLK